MRDSSAAFGLILILLATLSVAPSVGAQQSQWQPCTQEPCGPNMDGIIYFVYPLSGHVQEEASLRSGQIDMIPNIWSIDAAMNLTADQSVRVYRSPNGSYSVGSLFFNCRRPPFDDVSFRTAFSYLIDRNYMTDVLLKGWAEPSTTFVPPISDEWTNFNATAPQFGFENATRMLDKAGYTLNSQKDARLDPKTGKALRPITVLTVSRARDAALWAAGEVVTYYANAAGIKATHIVLPEYEITSKTMMDRDFDTVITQVTLPAAPFGLYALFHSSRDKEWTSAYSGIHDAALDKALEDLWFGNTKPQAQAGSQAAQARLATLLPYVPIYSIPNFAAISSNWSGAINMRGYGAANPWTYASLHAYGEPLSGTFVQSVEGAFQTLNPLLANRTQEWNVLEQVYSPLFAVDPATSHDLPVLATDWATEAWSPGAGQEGMKITFHLRSGVMWQDGQPFTSSDVKFAIEYLQTNKVPKYANVWSNLVKVEAPDSTTVQIYLNATGYRHVYDFAWMTFLPEHIWRDVKDYRNFKPWEEANPTVKGLTELVGQGPFILAQADLEKQVSIVWNPLYFAKNPQKPALLVRETSAVTGPDNLIVGVAGDIVTLWYKLSNFNGQSMADPGATYKLQVMGSDGTIILELPTTYTDGEYKITVDTSKLGAGAYNCRFNAAPYGVDTFTLSLAQYTPTGITPTAPAGQPLYLYGLVGVALVVVVACIYVVAKRTSKKKRTSQN